MLLNFLNFLTALTADMEREWVGPIEEITTPGGVADTLYKGAILMMSATGHAIVAADGAQASLTWPIGICKKQVVCAGSNAETVIIQRGKVWLEMSLGDESQAAVGTLVYPLDDRVVASGTSGIYPLGAVVGFKTGYVLVDMKIRSWAS